MYANVVKKKTLELPDTNIISVDAEIVPGSFTGKEASGFHDTFLVQHEVWHRNPRGVVRQCCVVSGTKMLQEIIERMTKEPTALAFLQGRSWWWLRQSECTRYGSAHFSWFFNFRIIRKRRSCDQCCRNDVKEVDGTYGILLRRVTENLVLKRLSENFYYSEGWDLREYLQRRAGYNSWMIVTGQIKFNTERMIWECSQRKTFGSCSRRDACSFLNACHWRFFGKKWKTQGDFAKSKHPLQYRKWNNRLTWKAQTEIPSMGGKMQNIVV